MGQPIDNGRRIARYVVLRQLGHGNLTRVFLSTTRGPAGAELCVLKLMRIELAADDDFRALFLDQAATTLSLRHPNLVRTLDVLADAEACGLAMEFLEGQTLARVIERMGRTRFPVDMHLHILSKVLGALDYAHELARSGGPQPGFLHRDVCPNNVFITYDGEVKLLGMGFAEATRALELKVGRSQTDVRYAAPEVLLGDPAGPSADLFGVGIMIWEAVARRARVTSEDTTAVIQQRTSGEEPDLERAWPEAPLPMIEMCRRALASNPSERYASISELRVDLDAYLERASQPSEAVLRRLAESTRALFAPEREQMQLFIGSSLENASDNPKPSSARLLGTDDELTPHEEEWNGPTSARIPALHRLAAGDVAIATSPAAPDELVAVDTPARDLDAPRTPRMTPLQLTPFDVAAPRDSSTGGHRAYSTSLEALARRRPGRIRFSADMLGAAALIVGSIVAVYSLHRHSLRDKKTESEQLAIQAEAHPPTPPGRVGPPDTGGVADSAEAPPIAPREVAQPLLDEAPTPSDADRASSTAATTPVAIATVIADAGPSSGEERRVSTPAFFDGTGATLTVREAAAPLNADELPAVDPELSSLQEEILMHAKARRLMMTKHKRDKKAEARSATAIAPSSRLPGQIEDVDPYTDASSP